MTEKLKIAVQKSGRLSEGSLKLLKECSIEFDNHLNKLKAVAFNFPLEVFFLRDDDIPQYVEDGVADIGIVGKNVVLEKNRAVKLVQALDFGKCRLSIAVPKNSKYQSIKDLEGKRIATSYIHILEDYLKKNQISAEIHEISGSVEIATSIDLADAICDLVSSGSTLFTNGLKEFTTILESHAVMISGNSLNEEKLTILEKLLFRINAVRQAKNSKYILLNAPTHKLESICQILPGIKSPTILPLAREGWSSIHSVVEENRFWEIIEKLKAEGAEGILVVPIEKMIL